MIDRAGERMKPGSPSQTALKAAQQRAVHQILEHGKVFNDPLAVRIVGNDIDRLVEDAKQDPYTRKVRIFLAVRSRFMQDRLRAAIDNGAEQFVVLGAGLDTSAYRSEVTQGVRTFEVDHPSTQAWKQSVLSDAGIVASPNLTYVPVDFQTESLVEALTEAGLDETKKTFFSWLGVVLYLDEPAIRSTLCFVAGLCGGSEIVFDYSLPPSTLSPEDQERHAQRAAGVAALGEPWISYFEPKALHSLLDACGFTAIEDYMPTELLGRYLPGHQLPIGSSSGARLVHAVRHPA
jgi:methyltransferase (TIGR00027 family)